MCHAREEWITPAALKATPTLLRDQPERTFTITWPLGGPRETWDSYHAQQMAIAARIPKPKKTPTKSKE
jgi:hypothetical protein